mmetsp:Transcript_119363/g.337684  ORF Transcript_119363/g.337684 Transcript_119363/m.337684 type:complete len:1017 (-) Transcript_119363:108-3158(-)
MELVAGADRRVRQTLCEAAPTSAHEETSCSAAPAHPLRRVPAALGIMHGVTPGAAAAIAFEGRRWSQRRLPSTVGHSTRAVAGACLVCLVALQACAWTWGLIDGVWHTLPSPQGWCFSSPAAGRGVNPAQDALPRGAAARLTRTAMFASAPARASPSDVAKVQKVNDAYRAVEGLITQQRLSQRKAETKSRTWRKNAQYWPEAPPTLWAGDVWLKDLSHGSNLLFHDEGEFPRYSEIQPEHARRGIKWIGRLSGHELWELYCSPQAQRGNVFFDWAEIMYPLEYLTDMFERVYSILQHMRRFVNPSEEMESIWVRALKGKQYVLRRLWRSEKFMPKFKRLLQSDLSCEAQRRTAASQLISFERGGVNIQAYGMFKKDTTEFIAFYMLYEQLASIQITWEKNIYRDLKNKPFLMRKRDEHELRGIPGYVMKDMAAAAAVLGYPKATAEDGPWMITLDDATVDQLLRHAEAREFRDKVYKAHRRIAYLGGAGKNDNLPYLIAMVDLRGQMARVIGYDHYAAMMFTTRMATVKQVYGFLGRLRKESFPVARKELRELQDFAREQGADYKLDHHDLAFWRQRLLEHRFSLRQDYIQQFFPLPAVLEGLFGLLRRLFGVDVVAADEEVTAWNEHIRFFRVLEADSDGDVVGSFFLDPYRRRGNKTSGFHVERIHGYSPILGRHGQPRLPAVHIVCDFASPDEGRPVLLTMPEVAKLFHVVGLALREILCNTTEGLVAGTSGMELDVAAIPGYFMERWAWEESTLLSISRHVETGDPLPDAAIKTIAASRTFHNGMTVLHRTALAQIDMELHTRFDPNGTMGVFDVAKIIEAEFAVVPPSMGDFEFCKVPINSEGVCLYCGLWSEALAAGVFAEFEAAGLGDETAVAELGRRFRRFVLAPGAGRSPSAALEDFHGHKLSLGPFLAHAGLGGAKDEAEAEAEAEADGYRVVYEDEGDDEAADVGEDMGEDDDGAVDDDYDIGQEQGEALFDNGGGDEDYYEESDMAAVEGSSVPPAGGVDPND